MAFGLRSVGKTTDDKIVISGSDVFNFVSSQGLPLDITVDLMWKRNLIVDWIGFLHEALAAGWKVSTVLRNIKNLTDVLEHKYVEETIKRLEYYMTPLRKTWIDGKKIEEYLWEGEPVVYINSRLERDKTYDEVIKELMGI